MNWLGNRRCRARRPQPQRPMRPRGVVVRGVHGKHPAQVSLTEDQHPVGDFGTDGQHEALGEAVRPGTPRRDLHHLNARTGQDRVERCRELSGPITDEEPEPGGVFTDVHDEVAGLLGGPGPIGMPGDAKDMQVAVADLEHEQDVQPPQRERAVDVEESTASMLAASARRNCRQLVSVCRDGAGGMRRRCRIRRMVEAPTR